MEKPRRRVHAKEQYANGRSTREYQVTVRDGGMQRGTEEECTDIARSFGDWMHQQPQVTEIKKENGRAFQFVSERGQYTAPSVSVASTYRGAVSDPSLPESCPRDAVPGRS